MLWIITCIAKSDIQAVRDSAAAAHKHYLDAKMREGNVVLSGSSFDHDGKTRIGSVYIIVNVKSYEEAKTFYDGEPFAKPVCTKA